MSDYPSDRSTRYCLTFSQYCYSFERTLVVFNSSVKFSVARPEQGVTYLCKICPIHDHLPAETTGEFVGNLHQL